MRKRFGLTSPQIAALALAGAAHAARAGPPFRTDDPDVGAVRQLEIGLKNASETNRISSYATYFFTYYTLKQPHLETSRPGPLMSAAANQRVAAAQTRVVRTREPMSLVDQDDPAAFNAPIGSSRIQAMNPAVSWLLWRHDTSVGRLRYPVTGQCSARRRRVPERGARTPHPPRGWRKGEHSRNEDHQGRLLHHRGGAVFFVARNER